MGDGVCCAWGGDDVFLSINKTENTHIICIFNHKETYNMRIIFYDSKSYDKQSFDKALRHFSDISIEYMVADLDERTAVYSKEYDAVCAFVNSVINADVLKILYDNGIRLVLMRCAGFNNVDVNEAGRLGITVMRVPGYSPEAVAELAMGLALAAQRRIHKAYIKVRENNFSLQGLTGVTLHGKTAGIVGTGKIGAAMCRICRGFGMKVIAYDKYHNESLDFVEYVELDRLLSESDLISLHCPLDDTTYHLIDERTIDMMKNGVILVNTSRGAIVNTDALIKGIRDMKFHAVGLDVYEEESDYVFENLEDDILQHSITARLLSFPNVIVTSHQGFLTEEALDAISETTLKNAKAFISGDITGENVVK